MEVKAYIKGYNLADFFAGEKPYLYYGKVEEVGSNYIIAKGALSHVSEQYWYTSVNSSGWLSLRPVNPIVLKGGKTYTLSFDITLLETIDGKGSFTAAVFNFASQYNYTLKNTLDRQRVVVRRTFAEDYTISNQSGNGLTISLNSLHVKIENIMLVEGEEEKPYDNGRIQVKPVIPVRNPKNLIPFPYTKESGYTQNGVTVEYDEYGTFTVNGETTVASADSIPLTKRFSLPVGDYTLLIPRTTKTKIGVNIKKYPSPTSSGNVNISVSPRWYAYSIDFSVTDEQQRLTFDLVPYAGIPLSGSFYVALIKKGEVFDNPITPQKCNIFIKE